MRLDLAFGRISEYDSSYCWSGHEAGLQPLLALQRPCSPYIRCLTSPVRTPLRAGVVFEAVLLSVVQFENDH